MSLFNQLFCSSSNFEHFCSDANMVNNNYVLALGNTTLIGARDDTGMVSGNFSVWRVVALCCACVCMIILLVEYTSVL